MMAWNRRVWASASAIMPSTDISTYSRRTSRTMPTSFITTTGKRISRTLPGPRAWALKLVTCAGEQASLTSTTTVFQISSWLQAMFTRKWSEHYRNTQIKLRGWFSGTWAKVYSKNSSRRPVLGWRRHTAAGDALLEILTTMGTSTY